MRPYKILQKAKASQKDNKKETNNEELKKHRTYEINNSKKHTSEQRRVNDDSRYYESNRRYKTNKSEEYNKTRNEKKYNSTTGGTNSYDKKYTQQYYRPHMKVKNESKNEGKIRKEKEKEKDDVLISSLKKEYSNIKKKKIIIRHLPPNLSEVNFFDSFSNNLKEELDYYYYVNGSRGKYSTNEEDIIHSRMYLSFKDDLKTEEFIKTQQGKFFYDTNGSKYKANVSLAPNQTIIYKNKSDDRNNTIDTDEYFLQFCEEMNKSPEPIKTDTLDENEIINVVNENGTIIPPIIIELRKKIKNNKTGTISK
ncbi:regulator of nonsense transcripts 3B, putative [Hepatocystis sp. ex Piliocolobus tephrosceles]|nr:regulator of nonsense transcripts 3B, putative [Hepatocystis sp. ex Piliocolobus tephrosceles]